LSAPADANDPTSSIAMSRTLRITRAPYKSDFGIAFGRASAKAQRRENGSHAVTAALRPDVLSVA
jgi:hypothetical protein